MRFRRGASRSSSSTFLVRPSGRRDSMKDLRFARADRPARSSIKTEELEERLLDARILLKSRDLRTFAEEIGVRLSPSESRR